MLSPACEQQSTAPRPRGQGGKRSQRHAMSTASLGTSVSSCTRTSCCSLNLPGMFVKRVIQCEAYQSRLGVGNNHTYQPLGLFANLWNAHVTKNIVDGGRARVGTKTTGLSSPRRSGVPTNRGGGDLREAGMVPPPTCYNGTTLTAG
jgi:hypothetical protein